MHVLICLKYTGNKVEEENGAKSMKYPIHTIRRHWTAFGQFLEHSFMGELLGHWFTFINGTQRFADWEKSKAWDKKYEIRSIQRWIAPLPLLNWTMGKQCPPSGWGHGR